MNRTQTEGEKVTFCHKNLLISQKKRIFAANFDNMSHSKNTH